VAGEPDRSVQGNFLELVGEDFEGQQDGHAEEHEPDDDEARFHGLARSEILDLKIFGVDVSGRVVSLELALPR
jgi:hypothetical protein